MKKLLVIAILAFVSIVACTNRDGEIIDLINSVKKQNEDLKTQITALKKTTDSALVAVLKVSSLQATNDKKIDLIQTDLKTILSLISSLTTQMTAANADLFSLKTKIDALQAKCAELVAQIALLNGSSAQINLKEGLVAYYPFNGNAKDATENKNDGISTKALLVADRKGNLNSAYSFNTSIKSFIKLNSPLPINSFNKLSIVCWAKKNAPADNGVLISSWYSGDSASQPNIYGPIGIIFTLTALNEISVSFNGGTQITTTGEPISSKTDWNMYTVVFDVSNSDPNERLKIYINCNLKPLSSDFLKDLPSRIGTSANLGMIGARGTNNVVDGDYINGFFNGIIDDIGIWNKVLTAEEIKFLYDNDFKP